MPRLKFALLFIAALLVHETLSSVLREPLPSSVQLEAAPLGSALLPPANESCQCCAVNASRLWRKATKGLDSKSAAIAAAYLAYDFLVPKVQLAASLSYYGPSTRLRKFVSDLWEGTRPLKVGVLGGSMSVGVCVDDLAADSWFGIVTNWLRSASGANLTAHNGAISGTPASCMLLCLDRRMDPDVDLVFVEFARNDGFTDVLLDNAVVLTMERLLRRVLDLPGRPAVVMVEITRSNKGFDEYYMTSEHQQAANQAYYDIPTASPNTPMHQLGASLPEPGFAFADLYSHHPALTPHPSLAGQKVIADSVVHLLQSAVLDLLQRPVGQQERRDWEEPLPEPMHPGNVPPAASSCTLAEELPRLVRAAHGFTYVAEASFPGNQRLGYLADQPGSHLELQIRTVLPGRAPAAWVDLVLAFIVADHTPGLAVAECVAGCACEPGGGGGGGGSGGRQAVDLVGSVAAPYAMPYTSTLVVTQSEACRVRVSVMNVTARHGHKFKLVSVMVAERRKTELGGGNASRAAPARAAAARVPRYQARR